MRTTENSDNEKTKYPNPQIEIGYIKVTVEERTEACSALKACLKSTVYLT